jgi:ADP-ribose pyrophosphatase YjhB (NUDIX family)
MRTARTIGIKEDGSEVILHPKSTCITVQLADWNKIAATGIPKGFVAVDYQTSDGAVRTLREDTLVTVKEANARAEQKQKDAAQWHKKQADARAAAEKAEAEERQKLINAANAAKELAKAAIVSIANKNTPKK